MKHIFFTTTILALGTLTASTTAHSLDTQTLSSAEFSQLSAAVATTSTAVGLHTGDFQVNAKSAKANNMYRGEGASLMHTIMQYRD